MSALDLSCFIQGLADSLKGAVAQGTDIELDLASELPPVALTPDHARSIVEILVTSAASALEGARGKIAVRTSLAEVDKDTLARSYPGKRLQEGTYACLEVRDTGQPIEDMPTDRLFDPARVEHSPRVQRLMGLPSLMRRCRGTIVIDREPSWGAVIRIYLPCLHQAEPAQPDRGEQADLLGGKKVLVVDDEEYVRLWARTVLRQEGFNVLTAASGREGIEVFRGHAGEIAVVLLDMLLPQMDGEEVAQELRRIRPDIPVIFSSGISDARGRELGKRPHSAFVQKPYQPEVLFATIRRLLAEGVSQSDAEKP